MKALILNQESYADAGHIAEALVRRGFEYELLYRETADWSLISATNYDAVVLLGSMVDPRDNLNHAVKAELELVAQARRKKVPTLGVCYGAELMVIESGASLFTLQETCLGYRQVKFSDLRLPSGPQFFWCHLGFTAPPGSTALAGGPEACWAFIRDRAVGVQFHPDATPVILRRWTQEGTGEIEGMDLNADEIVRLAEKNAAYVSSFCDAVLDYLLDT